MSKLYIIFLVVLAFLAFVVGSPTSDKSIRKNMERERKKAQHPPIPKQSLVAKPHEGHFILGKHKNRYVVWDTNKAPLPHVACLASSGGGKTSSVLLPFVMLNPNATYFCIDLKGEIVEKGTFMDAPNICIVQPSKKSGYGFDVFAGLSDSSTEDEIYEVLQTITLAIIPSQKGDAAFWSTEAQNMFLGLSLFLYGQGNHDFIDIIDQILSNNIQETIQRALTELPYSSKAYRCLSQFDSMAEETITSIIANMCVSLQIYSNDSSVRYLFTAPLKVSHYTLEAQRSIFLCIPDAKLDAWNSAICVIIALVLKGLTYRSEDSHQIYMLLDELGSIVSHNGLPQLVTSMQIMRSRKLSIALFLQQQESLESSFTPEECTTILGNCGIKIFLDSSSPKTQELVSKNLAPYYISRKQSKNNGQSKSNSYSFEMIDVIRPSDMMQLVKNSEAIIFTPNIPYAMVKKAPYFSDPYLKPVADKIKEHNKKFKGR